MTMKKLFSLFAVALLAVAVAQAQRVRFELQIDPAVEGEVNVYVLPLTAEGNEKAMQLRGKEGKYVGGVTPSEKGLYSVAAVCDNRQLMSTIHVVPGADNKAQLTLKM